MSDNKDTHQPNTLKRVLGFVKSVLKGNYAHPSYEEAVSKKSSIQKETPAEKQRRLEEACERLFERQELINSGKLHMLGIAQIKKKFGKSWPGLKKIIYQTINMIIRQNVKKSDIFFRYKEEGYVILFAHANKEEATAIIAKIADEVRRALFDREEEELREIAISGEVGKILSKDVLHSRPISGNIIDAYKMEEEIQSKGVNYEYETEPQEKAPSSDAHFSSTLDLPTKAAKGKNIDLDLSVEEKEKKKKQEKSPKKKRKANSKLNHTFVPLWDASNNTITHYLCLAQGSALQDNPYDNHNMYFLGMSQAEKEKWDMEMLNLCILELQDIIADNKKLFIACPFHFETLSNMKSFEKLIIECQKIPDDIKKCLIFYVFNMPHDADKAIVKKFASPLKTHCADLFAQVPPNKPLDLNMLRDVGFSGLGIRLKASNTPEKKIIEVMEEFCSKVKKGLIPKVFALDIHSLSVTTSAVCSGYSLLGGPIIHNCVNEIDDPHRFAHEDLFNI